jgi:putative FmdB family regulatory protein
MFAVKTSSWWALLELGKPFHWNHLIGSVNVPTYQYRCSECGRSFERTETISEHEAAQVRCPKCDSKKVTQIPGPVYAVPAASVYWPPAWSPAWYTYCAPSYPGFNPQTAGVLLERSERRPKPTPILLTNV